MEHNEPVTTKEYLGDSVYAENLDGIGMKLTTENGLGASNTIILELEVYLALIRFAEQNMGWKTKREQL